MSTVRRRANGDSAVKDSSGLASHVSKAFTAQASWEDKDEFLDVVYWMRQFLGLAMGLLWGFIPLKGIVGLGLFFLINVGLVYVYSSSFQKVDEEEMGGFSDLAKEGLMTSFATFLVAWIIVYSALHHAPSMMD